MYLIRSAEPRDAKAVLDLARILNSYNLPHDRSAIMRLLADSRLSFRGRPGSSERARYLFVMEEAASGKIVGCSLIIGRHGTPRLPHLSFRLAREVKRSRSLRLSVPHRTLTLRADRVGATEIGGLVLFRAWRRHPEKLGRQLSYARFAYMANFPGRFRPKVLVEYLPRLDKKAGSVLWDALGMKFTGLSYGRADRLSAENKEFILSLFPREKIYACLLPQEAVRELGVPGPGAEASLGILAPLGFRFLHQVDPFDGGPHYGAFTAQIPVLRATKFLKYKGLAAGKSKRGPSLLMNVRRGKVRAVVARYETRGGSLFLDHGIAALLKLRPGQKVTVTPLGDGHLNV
jgi:arginine N-succinyltransferase